MPSVLTSRFDVWAILAACVVALGAALVAQFGFGLAPCHLCTLQRLPYAFAAFTMLMAGPEPRVRALMLSLAAVIFLVGTGLAFFHVGVERHWWESACSGGDTLAGSAGGLLAKLAQGGAAPACDSVPFDVFGVSIAGMNLIVSPILALFAANAAWRGWRNA